MRSHTKLQLALGNHSAFGLCGIYQIFVCFKSAYFDPEAPGRIRRQRCARTDGLGTQPVRDGGGVVLGLKGLARQGLNKKFGLLLR